MAEGISLIQAPVRNNNEDKAALVAFINQAEVNDIDSLLKILSSTSSVKDKMLKLKNPRPVRPVSVMKMGRPVSFPHRLEGPMLPALRQARSPMAE